MKKRIFILLNILLIVFSLDAQEQNLDIGKRYLHLQQYTLAQASFLDHLSTESTDLDEAIYWIGFCSYKLSDPDGKFWYSRLLSDYKSSPYLQDAIRDLAFIYFKEKDYLNTEILLSQIYRQSLKDDEFQFKFAYSLFVNGKYDDAKYYFNNIKDNPGKYQSLSLYYYAHISYTKKLYRTSLSNFKLLKKDKKFGKIIPYYITQIYFHQQRYSDLIKYAVPILNSVIDSRKAETLRFISESYFQISDYENAEKYLKDYIESTEVINIHDYFQLGQINIFLEDYTEAILYFQKIDNVSDSLMQYSSYYLGESYIKTNQKSFALQAFKKAASYDSDFNIKEESLYNYFKLSYELDLPYSNLNEIMMQMDTLNFLKYKLELKRLMINIFQTTSQYQEAFDFLKDNHILNEDEKETLQRLSYYIAVAHYNNGNYINALSMFEYSRKYPENMEIEAMSIYSIADCYYNLNKYSISIDYYNDFLKLPSNFLFDKVANARYNLAYSYFKSDNYPKSIKYFRKAVNSDLDELRLNDAYLRLGDSYYMLSDFRRSRDNYINASNISILDKDYALYQQSKCSGFLSDYESQEKLLLSITREFGNSIYKIRSFIDLANLYKSIKRYDRALEYYDTILLNAKNIDIISSTKFNKSLIYFNQGKVQESVNIMKDVILNYPNTRAFNESQILIKDAYIKLGNAEKYIEFVSSIPDINLTQAYKDSITFQVALNNYKQEEYSKSIKNLEKYIDNFGNKAIFIDDANFYLAESYWNINDTANAIISYKKVMGYSSIDHLEISLLKLARVYYEDQDFVSSNIYYQRIDTMASGNDLKRESIIRLMLGYETRDISLAVNYADRVLLLQKNDNRIIARAKIIIARSDFDQGNYGRAAKLCDDIVKITMNKDGTEAMYMKAYFMYLEERYQETEDLIFLMADQYSSNHWIAKSFILLADVYMKLDNYYQAKATLESVIENHDGEDVINQARLKWQEIVDQESQKFDNKQSDPIIEINDFEYEINYDMLEIEDNDE